MATAGPVSVTWIPEDDLLLKNAVEAGASLEALAKGAVQFSRRFSFRELQDRWHSLLYDPDISAQASSRMFELELSGFSPLSRNGRYEHSKGNREVSEKRKIGSVRKQYYSMRKKFRTEFFNHTDLGFLDEPNLHHSGGHVADFQGFNGEPQNSSGVLGNPISNHLDFQEAEIKILRSAISKPARDSSIISGAVSNHSSYHKAASTAHEDKHPNSMLRTYRFSEDVSTSFGQNGMTFGPNVKCSLSTFPKDRSVNLIGCSGICDSGLPQSLEMQQLSVFDSTKDNRKNVIRGSRQEHHLSPPRDDSSFHTIGFSSAQPLWDTVDNFSADPTPSSVKQGDGIQDVDVMLTDDGKGNNSFVYDGVHSGPILGVSEGEFGDPDSLLNLSNEDEILLTEVDGKAALEKSYSDNLNSLLLSSPNSAPEDGVNNLKPVDLIIPESCPADPDCADHENSGAMTSSVNGDNQNVHHPEVNELSESTLAVHDHATGDGSIYCTLNTEDTEIPCNDDIFLLIHPSTSFGSSASPPNQGDPLELASVGSRKQIEPGMTLVIDVKDVVRSSNWSQKTGPSILPETLSPHSLGGPRIKSELHDLNSKDMLAKVVNKTIGELGHSESSRANVRISANGMLEDDISRLDFKAGEAPAIFPGAQTTVGGSVKMDLSESMVNPSTSDQEESQSDDDVPYFSDVEAMILEMDLDPNYQDTQRAKLVSRYQSEETKRSIIRFEQCVQSCMQRALTSLGAFAIFYGRHLRHYIRKTEVILGRSTDDAEVDIDLRKEGRANKISRQQAIVKMEANGSFYLKNLGKSSISVNGKSVAKGQLICLSSSCLIEIRGMSFIFETNQKFIRQYTSILQKSKGKSNKFEWVPEEET